jgi:Flp pilus assembly protein TadD
VVGALWEIVAWSGVFPVRLFPRLETIATTFYDLTVAGILPMHAAQTVLRLFAGFAVAAVIGIGAFCVSSLVSSYSFRLIQNGFFFFLVLAIAYRRLGSEAEDQERENALSLRHASRPRLAAVAGLLACIMMVAYWIPRVASAAYSNAANYTQDLSEAERLYRMAERLDAGNPDARYYHGMRLFQENKFAEAVPFMRDAISLGRARSADFSYLASSQSLAGDNAAAEQTMAEAWKLYPQSTFVMTRYAHEMMSNGNEAGAEAMFTLSRARNQRDANAWWTLFNEGSDAASDRAVKHPDQYTPLMDLRPLNALYAVRDERMMRFPEERKRLDMFR